MFVSTLVYITQPFYSLKNYDILLHADTLRIYSGDTLITSVDKPAFMMDTLENTVGIGVTDTSELGIRRKEMQELYRLEFSKNGKVISNIKVLTPRNQEAINEIYQRSLHNEWYWRELDGHYVVMNENFQYFFFGADFYENLSEVLHESADR